MARHDSSSDDDDSSAPRKRPRLDSASDGDDSHARRRARKAERKAAKRAKKAEKKERKRAKKAARRRDGADEPDVYLGGAAAAAPRRAAAAGARACAFARTGTAQEDGPRGLLRLAPRGREREGARRHVPRDGQVQDGMRGRDSTAPRCWACEVPRPNFARCLTCARCRSLRRFEGRNQASGYCRIYLFVVACLLKVRGHKVLSRRRRPAARRAATARRGPRRRGARRGSAPCDPCARGASSSRWRP